MQLANNPSFKLKFSALKFTYITYLLDRYVQGSKIFDFLPRWLAYGSAKWLLYIEYMIQKKFSHNTKNNLFIRNKEIKRIDNTEDLQHRSPIKRSLRGMMTRLFGEDEKDNYYEPGPVEMSRDLLTRGL